jgi:hypothetical protein
MEAQKKKTVAFVCTIDFSDTVVVNLSNEQKLSGEYNALSQFPFDDMIQLAIYYYLSYPKLTPPSTRLSQKLYQVGWKQEKM